MYVVPHHCIIGSRHIMSAELLAVGKVSVNTSPHNHQIYKSVSSKNTAGSHSSEICERIFYSFIDCVL